MLIVTSCRQINGCLHQGADERSDVFGLRLPQWQNTVDVESGHGATGISVSWTRAVSDVPGPFVSKIPRKRGYGSDTIGAMFLNVFGEGSSAGR